MALVDEITIRAKAGKGGDGVVRFLHEKGKEFGGPAGGDGGDGGSILLRAVPDLSVLARYRGRGAFRAGDGKPGGSARRSGKAGADVVIEVPVGAVITRRTDGAVFEFLTASEERVLLTGGRGGVGNARFASSTHQYPTESTPGKEGEESALAVELKIIADVGIVGLPNAGKSSLLNALTHARAKVGEYAFTTLAPNLGAYFGHIIADIPGLIEGAHEGKGLGEDFLRHIARTKVLIHCVAADVPDPRAAYETVRAEIAAYDASLSRKPEIVFLTKADLLSQEERDELTRLFEKKNLQTVLASVFDENLLARAGDALIRFLRSR